MEKYVLALDQGTSSSRSILFNQKGDICAVAQREFTQYFPTPGWVEHDPQEIWSSQRDVMLEALRQVGSDGGDIVALGITNQRETTIVWDATTGEPVYNAIVWQDRRTCEYCDSLKEAGLVEDIRQRTGLIVDAYFSATKIRWILENVPGVRERAERGELRFGTVDSWLVWKLTGGKVHVTDVSNASRTMLFNINTLQWDDSLLQLLGIPLSMMPQVCSSSQVYGYTQLPELRHQIVIAGIAGDQQAALFGQMCVAPGSVKNTYGTGCFLLMNTGEHPILSQNSLLTTVAWKIGDTVNYALEGSIKSSSDIETLAATVPDNGGIYFVPALTGMGAPYWDPYAKGSINGITRGTTAGHIARAALEGIAFQTMDIVRAMERDAAISLSELKVDGGASCDNLLMQFQSDILGTTVIRPKITETTAKGASYLAGLAVGYWSSLDDIRQQWQAERVFTPQANAEEVARLQAGWKDAIERTIRQN